MVHYRIVSRTAFMNTIINSFLLILASEMGDKTQIVALILATRFRKPWTVMAGIFVATLLNHAMASYVGAFMMTWVDPKTLKWVLAVIFFIFAAWILVPDKEEEVKEHGRWGAFLTTVVAFFLAEMGDKTQLATVALGAKYGSPVLVTIGTTAGMLVADALAIFFGDALTQKIPMKWVRIFASGLFVLFGVGILLAKTGSP
jgi:putative Ca2+/H+ antiporter (TMEM165/GDT1 family)